MIRTVTAVVLLLVGLVGVAAGIWGIYTVATNDALSAGLAVLRITDLAPQVEEGENLLLDGANKVLDTAGNALSWLDKFCTDTFGRSATDVANEALGEGIDLTNEYDVRRNMCLYRVEILLVGVILMQTGLLMFKFGRR